MSGTGKLKTILEIISPSLYIALGDIVYDEATQVSGQRPEVGLAPLSTEGLSAVAISQNSMGNVYFDGKPLYTQAQLEGFDKQGYLDQVKSVLSGIRFESIDIHLYADYWGWEIYIDALKRALTDAGKPPNFPLITGEFGGAHPVLGSLDEVMQAKCIISYVHTMDDLQIRDAYFFKLVEKPNHDNQFWNSYLIKYNSLKKTIGYEVLRRFGLAAKK